MARKSGCPFSIKDYVIEVQDLVTELWVLVKGMTSFSLDFGSDTEDGRTGDALWSEPYITARNGSGTMEGKPLYDKTTGRGDDGQEMLNQAAVASGGCDNDQRLRLTDAIGNSTILTVIITDKSTGADDTGETLSYGFSTVGDPEPQPYIQATAIQAVDGATTLSETNPLAVTVNMTADFDVKFTPATASNQKFAISIGDRSIVRVVSIDRNKVALQGIAVGETTITLRSMNNNLTTAFKVAVA
jgi:hypothetical protein